MIQSPLNHSIVLSCIVENHPGVAMKITGMFARRGFNIISIVAAPIEEPGLSRIFIHVIGDDRTFDQIQKQMNKLVEVIKVTVLTSDIALFREFALIKISVESGEDQQKLFNYASMFNAKISDVSLKHLIIEICDIPEKLDSFIEILRQMAFHFKVSRTGMIGVINN